MSDRTKRSALVFALVVVMMVLLAGTLFVATEGPSSSTTTSAVIVGSTTSATGTGSETPNGLKLEMFANATSLRAGQSLNIAVSVVNTLPMVNDVLPGDTWEFQGVPVAAWPPCYFGLPIQVAVVSGNYTVQQLSSVANYTFTYECAESVTVDHVIFQPSSDSINLTGIYHGGGTENQTLGPFNLAANFTTSGYWDLENLSKQLNVPIIGELSEQTPPSTPFAPGTYTVAAEDEWGQVDLWHLAVSAGGPETFSSTDSLGLRLQVILNTTNVLSGGDLAAGISVSNVGNQNLSMVVNSSSGSILSWNGYDYFCNGVDSPVHYVVGYALFEGHVTSGNVSSSSPLLLAPEVGVGCVLYSGPPDVAILPSDSGNATLSGPDLPPVSEQISLNATTLYCTWNGSGGYCGLGDSISGWWNMTSNQFASAATLDSPYYTPLQPGEYTLVAQDAFAQTVYAYFEVT